METTLAETQFRTQSTLPHAKRMYAITFDLDQESLNSAYPGNNPNNAYSEIRKILQSHGFEWTQGSVYFGGETIDAVKAVMAAQDCSKKLPWFKDSVRDIRMLRIEDNNDLTPAILSV